MVTASRLGSLRRFELGQSPVPSESSVEEIVFVRESCWAMCLLNSFAFLLDHSGRDYWSSTGEFEVEHCEIGESSFIRSVHLELVP
jgi:hypothetical protein